MTNLEGRHAVIGAVALVLVVGVIGVGEVTSFVPDVASVASVTSSSLCLSGVSDVRIESNSNELDGQEAFFVEVTGACADHVVTGGEFAQVSKDQLQGYSSSQGEKVSAQNGFSSGMTSFSPVAYSNIDYSPYSADRVPSLGHRSIECDALAGCGDKAYNTCSTWQSENSISDRDLDVPYSSVGSDFEETDVGLGNTVLHCFRAEEPKGSLASFEGTTQRDFTASFQICSGGNCNSKTVTRSEAEGGFTVGAGSQQAHIQLRGSLLSSVMDVGLDNNQYKVSCENCGSSAENSDWTITTRNNIDDYESVKSSFASSAEQAIAEGRVQDAQAQYSSTANRLFRDESSRLLDDLGSNVWENVRTSEGRVELVPNEDDALGRPNFIYRIMTDWVGVDITVGQPTIQDVTGITIKPGESRDAEVSVRNTASNDRVANMKAIISCPAGLNGGSQSKKLSPGETGTYRIGISSSTTVEPDQTVNCNVEVKDTDAEQVQASAAVPVRVAGQGEDIERQCSDGRDNDGDGLVDKADPDCGGSEGGLPLVPLGLAGGIIVVVAVFRRRLAELVGGVLQ